MGIEAELDEMATLQTAKQRMRQAMKQRLDTLSAAAVGVQSMVWPRTVPSSPQDVSCVLTVPQASMCSIA
jgi:hypothetical protein